MTTHAIVSTEKWSRARRALLSREKEFMKLRDELSQARRDLPWERVSTSYAFEGEAGRETLADLFGVRTQLIVYHFMFAPEWEVGCKSCSFWADQFSATLPHLAARDVAFAAISRAPLRKLQGFAKRMGWRFKWVSSGDSEFNFDYHVSFRPEAIKSGTAQYNEASYTGSMTDLPGFSVFLKDTDNQLFHTYSTYGRGLDPMNAAYQLLDLVPRGRGEAGLPQPMAWVRLHDLYAG